MNKHQQSGMTTLLITSMLLIVALLFSLASYKNLFYQIKRTQNEVLARQAHWAAEGGLECGFAAIKNVGSISGARPTYIDDCRTSLKSVYLDADNYINSKYKNISNKEIKKKIKLSSSIAGAIQSRSDLTLIGDYLIRPDVDGLSTDGNYKCVSIRYSNVFLFDKTEPGNLNTKLKVIDPITNGPYLGFNGKCADDYKSFLNTTTDSSDKETKKNLKFDFVYDPIFDPFESFFKNTKDKINEIKNDYEVIYGSKSEKDKQRCDYLIAEAFKLNDKVWVEGDCDLLNAVNFENMKEVDKNKPKILVISNGIVATVGASVFNGFVYHYIHKDSNIYIGTELADRWALMPSYNFNSGNNLIKRNALKNSVFINSGSFYPTGGMIFDTLNGHTTLISGMNLVFTNEANPNPPSKKISWQQGSWHDF